MRLLKRVLLFLIGIAVLFTVAFIFFRTQKSTDLEGDTLKNWPTASTERRVAATKILLASEENVDSVVACVDKMATLPDSTEMKVRDAVSLCYTGIQLKANL